MDWQDAADGGAAGAPAVLPETCTTWACARASCRPVGSSRAHGRQSVDTPGRTLLVLPDAVTVVPIRALGTRMAKLADAHRLSTLGAEAVAAAEHLGALLVVWNGDDGPAIRQQRRHWTPTM